MSDFSVQGASVSLPSFNPGAASDGPVAVSRRGETLVIPAAQGWVNKERVYIASNAAKQTALATGGTSYSDTAPAFILDVAAGTTMIPLSIGLRQGGTVAGGVITVIVTADIGNRYSSGGTAITARNLKIGGGVAAGNRRASGVTVYGTSPTASAVNTHISLQSTILTPDVGAGTLVNSPNAVFEWPKLGEVAPELIGPASLVIYTYAGTTQPSWYFNFKWLEIDS